MRKGAMERTKVFKKVRRGDRGKDDSKEETANEVFPPVIRAQPPQFVIILGDVLILTQAVDESNTRIH